MSPEPVTIRAHGDLDLEALERVADGAELRLDPGLLASVDEARREMLAALAVAPAGVYGVSTGTGYLAGTALDPDDLARHARELLLGRAVGSAPHLPRDEARALVAARLVSLLSGHAGASAALCAFLADRLNDGFVPAVPRGSDGTAGEVIALSHAFQTVLGVGLVLTPDGGVEDAGAALAARGAAPYAPLVKEGIALLAGAPGTIAVAMARRRAGAVLAGQLRVGAAAAIAAIGAPRGPYSAEAGELADDPVLDEVLEDLRDLLGPDPEDGGGGRPQAPVSFRVAPQALAHLDRTLDRLEAELRRALGAVSDSPALAGGRFVSTGAFHEIGLAAGMDALALALAHAGELATARVHRLLDARFSGLPDQLSPTPGPRCGLVVVHKRMVGTVGELRRLAAPATLGLTDTSLGQEDAMTHAFAASEQLRRAEGLVRELVACELLAARQAWHLRGAAPAAGGLARIAALVADAVPPVDEDRPLGPDIDALVALLASGAIEATAPR
ncbi:MAG: histidine ammonia-lyase [Miltoncostaeaceae bacterium]|jgi:histidine ammonia-lyase|nr:histidine ammonia-lyase [Miltoncostaeaceae bacterium]